MTTDPLTWHILTPDGRTVASATSRALAETIVAIILPGHRVLGPEGRPSRMGRGGRGRRRIGRGPDPPPLLSK